MEGSGDDATHNTPTRDQPIPWLDTGRMTVVDTAIRATATMTLALPKEGLRALGVTGCVGELYCADIRVPRSLYAQPALGLDAGPIHAPGDRARL